jgi:DNA-binding transcriptional MerR regulator
MAATAQLTPEPERLYRIGDVSRITDTKPFVLRFWETEFPMLQPVKAPKGHRLYREEDIELIRAIKRLLYEEGFTIPGARRHLTELLANGQGLASLSERAALAAPAAVSGSFAEPAGVAVLDAGPVGAAETDVPEPAASPEHLPFAAAGSADAGRALLAVRDELRAILTLLEPQ